MLLENFPHLCSIFRKGGGGKGTLGGKRYGVILEQEDVSCWEQQASASEVQDYAKQGIKVDTKIFFTANPNVTERHRILITSRDGVAESNLDIDDVSNPSIFDVKSSPYPDASAGLGVVWRVMCSRMTGATQ